MKKYLFVIMFIAVSLSASAQSKAGTFTVIPRLGVNIANLSNDKMSVGADKSSILKSKSKAGMVAGADIQYQATDMFAVSLGAFYSMQGDRFPDFEVVSGKTYTGFSDYLTNLQYVNVPIMLNYYVAEGFALKVGVQGCFAIGGKNKYKSTDFTKDEHTGEKTYGETISSSTSLNNNLNAFDFVIPVGASYEFNNVIIDARYNLGMSKVYKKDELFGDSKNRCITVTVGYKFDL